MIRTNGTIPLILALGCILGCRSSRNHQLSTQPTRSSVADQLEAPRYLDDLHAVVSQPAGWRLDTRADTTTKGHRVWVSPSGKTAYGVIHFSLPLPVGHDPVLWIFLREMRRSEGEARLLSKQWDVNRRMLCFVAKGGMYTVRTNLIVRGFNGWAVYAGNLSRDPVVPDELALAERARELTLVGRASGRRAVD